MKNTFKSLQSLFLAAFVALFAGCSLVIAQTGNPRETAARSESRAAARNCANPASSRSVRPRIVQTIEYQNGDRAIEATVKQPNAEPATPGDRKPGPALTVTVPTGKGLLIVNRQPGSGYNVFLGGRRLSIGNFR